MPRTIGAPLPGGGQHRQRDSAIGGADPRAVRSIGRGVRGKRGRVPLADRPISLELTPRSSDRRGHKAIAPAGMTALSRMASSAERPLPHGRGTDPRSRSLTVAALIKRQVQRQVVRGQAGCAAFLRR